MITDEMVEKALEAAEDAYPESKRSDMRAALEAVAPLLIAQGMREAASVARDKASYLNNMGWQSQCDSVVDTMYTILARAQELDPK
ncbi:MAG: hypothetical protein EHM33_00485 [Chloroflexi bacterium]|nr:MAG: hypothetical protein EHM33_00485 [Chloroflexota bacterium]